MRSTQQESLALVHQQFDDVSSAYRNECLNGILTSVRERYELRLARIRVDLRSRRTSCRLGEVLKAIGALSATQLERALQRQRDEASKRLLGEILLDLGWVDEKELHRAVDIQRSVPRG